MNIIILLGSNLGDRLANLKQALNYSSDNLAIPDSNLKLPSNNLSSNNKIPTKQKNTNTITKDAIKEML